MKTRGSARNRMYARVSRRRACERALMNRRGWAWRIVFLSRPSVSPVYHRSHFVCGSERAENRVSRPETVFGTAKVLILRRRSGTIRGDTRSVFRFFERLFLRLTKINVQNENWRYDTVVVPESRMRVEFEQKCVVFFLIRNVSFCVFKWFVIV